MQRQMLRKVSKLKARKTASKVNLKSSFDAWGSYTGVDNYDKYETPVQDADDL